MFSAGQLALLFTFLTWTAASYAQKSKHFFRDDYTYLDSTKSFYKMQTVPQTFNDAIQMCDMEGATLFYPENDKEEKAILELWKRTYPEIDGIGIGVVAVGDSNNYLSMDGQPISEVYHNWAPGQPDNPNNDKQCIGMRQKDGQLFSVNCLSSKEYYCKKTLKSLKWNIPCNMPYTDYTYDKDSGKCFKFHLNPMSWSDAYLACFSEESSLAYPESQEEDNFLVNLTEEAPKEDIQGNFLRGAVLLGFGKSNSGWMTLDGQKLENAGFHKWASGQPDNAGGNEICGSMFYNGELNDVDCSVKMFFICEHDPKSNN